MAPRKSTHRRRSDASPTAPVHRETGEPSYTSDPWPRQDGLPFTDDGLVPLVPNCTKTQLLSDTGYNQRRYGHAWDRYDRLFYNGLLPMQMLPTRFIDRQILERMGIFSEVRDALRRMGLGTMPFTAYPLYPELARQFLASCELRFEDTAHPDAQTGTLGYLCFGHLYEISIPELCRLYGFDEEWHTPRLPEDHLNELWELIGSGNQDLDDAKISRIRNPVLRIVAKVLSHTLFCKEEATKLRYDEVLMLHYALPSDLMGVLCDPPPEELLTNLGAVFAEFLVQRKFRGLRGAAQKAERIGSLLTPIFRFHGLTARDTPCDRSLLYFDERFFRQTYILQTDLVYSFTTSDGASRHLQLPRPDLTTLSSPDNLRFDSAPYYTVAPRPPRRRGGAPPRLSTSRRPSVSDIPGPSTTAVDEMTLPPYTGEYDLPELPATASTDPHMAWVITSTQRNHSMLRRIWDALTCRSQGSVRIRSPVSARHPAAPAAPAPPSDDDSVPWDSTDDADIDGSTHG